MTVFHLLTKFGMSNLHVGGKQRLFLSALEDKDTLGLFDNALVQGQNYFREAWEDFPSCRPLMRQEVTYRA